MILKRPCHTAIARSMMAEADRIRDQNPRLAFQLGVAALYLDPNPSTQASLMQALRTSRYETALAGPPDWGDSVIVSPDGHTFATDGDDHTATILWDLTDGTKLHQLSQFSDNEIIATATPMAFSQDGHTLATRSFDNSITLWDVTNRDHPRPLAQPLPGPTEPTGRVASVAFSPDGHTLATISADKTMVLWDLTDRSQPHQLGPPFTNHGPGPEWPVSEGISKIAFSPDGRTLATANDDSLILWDLTDRTKPHRLDPLPVSDNGTTVDSVTFSPDGHTLATTSYGARKNLWVNLWDVTDRDHPRLLGRALSGHTDYVISVAFSPDGHTLATVSRDKTVILWDLTDRDHPRQLGPPLTGHTDYVYTAKFSPDGHTLVTASGDKTVILWHLTDPYRGQPRQLNPTITDPSDTAGLDAVVFSPDGHTLVTIGEGATNRAAVMILWDVTDRTKPHQLGPPFMGPSASTSSHTAVAFSPDGHTLATVGSNKTLLWDVTDRTKPRQLGPPFMGPIGPANSVDSVAFSPDGHTLATGGAENTLLWDITDRTKPRQLGPPFTRALGPVAFSPDGHTLATSGGNKALLWDVTDRTKPRQLDPPLMSDSTSYGTWAAFSPDGHTLATTASSDKMVILWDVTDRTKPHQLGLPLTGYTDAVSTMAFSPDGHTLATGNLDENLLWDVTDQDQPRQLGPLHASGLDGDDLYGDSGKSMAFSPDGHTLAVVNIGQTVLWDLTPIEDLRRNTVREACIRTGKPLDTVMWAFYAPDISYQDTCADAIGPK